MHEHVSKADATPETDDLFLERFEAFMEKTLTDLRAFSDREERPFEEMRYRFAEWHTKRLLTGCSSSTVYQTALEGERATQTRSILVEVSHVLESLCQLWGIQSFVLAVDPQFLANESFLGGTTFGRNFWRTLRGGGESGASSFKQHCIKQSQMNPISQPEPQSTLDAPVINNAAASSSRPPNTNSDTARLGAREAKSELYDAVRKSLRTVSGIPNAEMKWTQPDRLGVYGVSLVGWPSDIPAQNPSSLNLSQNKRLLGLVQDGTLGFMRTIHDPSAPGPPLPSTTPVADDLEADAMFAWAIQDDPGMNEGSRPPKRLRMDEN